MTLGDLCRRTISSKRRSGFTLVDFMVASTLSILVIGGIIFAQIAGLKMYNLTKAKLGASDQARAALNLLVTEVRSGKIVRVGNWTGGSFQAITEGSLMQGNAIKINSTTNTNHSIQYYLDQNDKKLKRIESGITGIDTIAEFITNNVLFTLENFRGQVLTASQNNRVVGVSLQFFQVQYPVVTVGAGGYYDFYQLRTKVTRRVLE